MFNAGIVMERIGRDFSLGQNCAGFQALYMNLPELTLAMVKSCPLVLPGTVHS